MFAIKLLFASTVRGESSIFEERIIMVQASNPQQAEQLVKRYFVADSYENANGEQNTVTLEAVLDCFEVVDQVPTMHLVEVYSRYFIYDEPTTSARVIEDYRLNA